MFKLIGTLLIASVTSVLAGDKFTLGQIAKYSGVSYKEVVREIERDKGLIRGVQKEGYIFKAYYADDLLDDEVVQDLANQIKPLLGGGRTYKISVYGYTSRKRTDFPGGKPALADKRAELTAKYLKKYLSGQNVLIEKAGWQVLGPSYAKKEFGKYQYAEARVHVNLPEGPDCNKIFSEEFGGIDTTEKVFNVGGASRVTIDFNSYSIPDEIHIPGAMEKPLIISTDNYNDNYGMDAAVRFCYVESAKVKMDNPCLSLVTEMMTSKVLDRSNVSAILIGTEIPELEPVHDRFINYLKHVHKDFAKDKSCLNAWKHINDNKFRKVVLPKDYLNGRLKVNIKPFCGKAKWKIITECY